MRWELNIEFLEQGNIFFFYKPKRGVDEVHGLGDISRFYFVLDPYGGKNIRFIVLGPKKMPSVSDGQDRAWGFVEKVGGRGFAVTNPQRTRPFARGARPAGEGIYAIVKHADHTHLVYSLELPARVGEVQKTLNISREASFIFIVKHPDASVASAIDRQQPEPSDKGFVQQFGSRRYIPVNPPELLDYEGAMLLIIGVNDELASLGLSVNKNKETEETADIFRELKVNKDRHPTDPLLKGKWK